MLNTYILPEASIISNFEQTCSLARGTRWDRFTHAPLRYCMAMLQKKLIYPLTGKTRRVLASPFFGGSMELLLPAGTDIYLTGGRADDAELRLTNFLLLNMKKADVFIDIGAHFGFYSCLAVQAGAMVHAFEPSPLSFDVLRSNSAGRPDLQVHPFIVGETDAEKSFCSFDPKYSEYDTTDPAQYEGKSWYRKARKQLMNIRCITLDSFTMEHHIHPDYIKIDTEGSETAVIAGTKKLLSESAPVVIMEYLAEKRGNTSHRKALELLAGLGYNAHMIREDGALEKCEDPELYLGKAERDSENLVFKKHIPASPAKIFHQIDT